MFSDGGIVIDGDYDVCDTTDLISILITDLSSDWDGYFYNKLSRNYVYG